MGIDFARVVIRELFYGNKNSDGAVLRVWGKEKQVLFEQTVLPHLGAAYNLARWLTRNEHDAEDMVQEAYLRAFRFFAGFHGTDVRPWLLSIVRNCCYSWLQQNRTQELSTEFDEEKHSTDADSSDPAALALQNADHEMLKGALDQLPVEFREVVVLRDLEGLSYKEIADIANIPTGTVMSRLARARDRLKRILSDRLKRKS